MKHFTTTILALLCMQVALAQYGDLGIKTRFDNVYAALYGPIYNSAVTTNNINDQGSLTWDAATYYTAQQNVFLQQDAVGSSRSGSLIGLITMYEATCDKKYLWEFMEQATQIVNVRADKISPQQSVAPYWFINSVYYHGRILMSFSKFVYLVKSTPALYSEPIPLAHRPNFANKTTFGAFADWLNTNNIEVMDYLMGRYWRGTGNDECMCKPSSISALCTDSPTEKSIMELNMQAPFGYSMIYMYLTNGDSRIDYATKAVQMARAYLVSTTGILYYSSTNHSYSWYHDGWQQERANTASAWVDESDHVEDIAHAGWDLMFPILYNKFYNRFYSHVTAGQYFEDYQMVRFKNAFSRVVYNYNLNIPQSYLNGTTFDCNLNGNCTALPGGFATSADYQASAKMWTSLYKFDDHSDSQGDKVYDIMMNFYDNVEKNYPITEPNYGGLNMSALADLAAANYAKEGLNVGCYTKKAPAAALEEPEAFDLTVSPNPATDQIVVKADETVDFVEIYDVQGRLRMRVTGDQESIHLGKLENGSYLVKVWCADKSVTRRVSVLH